MRMRNLLVVATVLAFASGTIVAQAQTYVVQRPGQLPAFVKRTRSDSYVVKTPGRPPAFVTRTPSGGSVVQTPGRPPAFVKAMSSGGYSSKSAVGRRGSCIRWRTVALSSTGEAPVYLSSRRGSRAIAAARQCSRACAAAARGVWLMAAFVHCPG
jgi:hypothetical protein